MGDRATRRKLPPNGHLFKLGLTNSPICERCLEKNELAVASLRLFHLGHYFVEPGNCHDTP
jgi:hypothetical protein